MVGWYHWLDGLEFEQAPGVVMDREAWHAAVWEVAKSWHDWATEPNWYFKKLIVAGSFMYGQWKEKEEMEWRSH